MAVQIYLRHWDHHLCVSLIESDWLVPEMEGVDDGDVDNEGRTLKVRLPVLEESLMR